MAIVCWLTVVLGNAAGTNQRRSANDAEEPTVG
jgi:hypothetical protein